MNYNIPKINTYLPRTIYCSECIMVLPTFTLLFTKNLTLEHFYKIEL